MSQKKGNKNITKRISKLGWVIPLSILALVFIFLGGFLPVFFDFSKLTCVAKAVFIVCYILGLALVIFLAYYDKNNKEDQENRWKDKLFSGFLCVIYVLGFLMFFDHNLWGYKEAVYGLMFLVVLFVEIFISINVVFGKKLDSEKLPTILISAAVLTFILAAVNETSNNVEPANLLYKLSFGIAYLVAVALFINSYLFKKRDSNKTIGNIVGIVFWGSLILTTFPYYVQWCGLKGDNFQTFVSVYAALIGGGITLAGVAWTIKDSNDKRKEDLERIEMERKEEERKIHVPYIRLANEYQPTHAARVTKIKGINFDDIEEVSRIQNDTYYSIKMEHFTVKNISKSNVLLKGVYLDNVYYDFSTDEMIECNSVCQVQFPINHWIAFAEKLKSIRLVISDILDNKYCVYCKLYLRLDQQPQKDTASNGIEYNVHSYTCTIENISLPEIQKEDSINE